MTFIQWVRRMHGWFGLWGAILGLLFGTSGIWLNHRDVLKLPPMAQQRINGQLALPDALPADAQAMGLWLQQALQTGQAATRVRVEPARAVAWTDKAPGAAGQSPALMQPERWSFSFGGPDQMVQADYWRGNRSVSVTTTSNGLMATLTNMHKGTGMSVPWILLVDSLAGSLLFLSISGLILWIQTNRRRLVGSLILLGSSTVTLGLALSRLQAG
jgi:hypothetical protein